MPVCCLEKADLISMALRKKVVNFNYFLCETLTHTYQHLLE
jgi:hypothetical protein